MISDKTEYAEIDLTHLSTEKLPQIDCLRDCPQIGACCRNMVVTKGGSQFPNAKDIEGARRQLQDMQLPLDVIGFSRRWDEEQKEWGYAWRVGCIMVLPDGLCGIYDSRPELCKVFTPGSDALCILHPRSEIVRGDSIVYPLTDLPDGTFRSDIMRKVYGKPLPVITL